jgi:hypothetical protein
VLVGLAVEGSCATCCNALGTSLTSPAEAAQDFLVDAQIAAGLGERAVDAGGSAVES